MTSRSGSGSDLHRKSTIGLLTNRWALDEDGSDSCEISDGKGQENHWPLDEDGSDSCETKTDLIPVRYKKYTISSTLQSQDDLSLFLSHSPNLHTIWQAKSKMAESLIISSVLPPIVEKAASLLLDRALNQYDIMVNIQRDIRRLKTKLNEVNEILQEAEERQIDNINVRETLRDLVDVGYEARDILDDFITFASTINTRRTTSRSVMFNCFPISFFLHFGTRFQLANGIKSAQKRLDELMEQRDIANIRDSLRKGGSKSESPSRRPKTSCYVNMQRNLFVGREDEKDEIIKKLVHHDGNDVLVVPIWGVGGVGKTTLAQSIYNDIDRVKEADYPIRNRKWLFVGEKKFNAKEIIERIIGESNYPDFVVIQGKLVEYFRGNKFLIVFDDVWNLDSDEWNLLFDPLTNVGNGGVIIITTRNREVISTTNTIVQNHLRPLSYEDCWKIFESHAFVDGKPSERPELEPIGREIVEKLDGLPLAAQVVGSSLLNEPDATWSNFLKTWERDLRNNNNKIMAALRWSYKLLPPHLKQCFAYCALFPKDHEFDEKVLVKMWMAHDLIQINVDGRPEDIGSQYFKELTYASLFQYVDERYVMHDMIHDLALHVSNEEFTSAVGSLSTDQMKKVRHITIPIDNDYSKNFSLCKSKRILTVYATDGWHSSTPPLEKDILLEVFKQSKSLRVLVLSNEDISEIPECISELKHLRYLDVKETSVKSLPYSLCQLHNLQMLAAPLDAVLPRDVVNICSLRYIRANVPTCRGIEKLTSLQELSSITVCEDDNIRELGLMRQLRGELKVKGLENISSSQEAAQALMQEKLYLDELELEFSRDLGKSSIENSAQVLDALRCPPNLKCLKIVGYTGVKFPSWMVDGKLFTKLQTLELSKCCQFEFHQLLGEMRSLEGLAIFDCSKIKLLDFSCLPSLRRLFVSRCDEFISISALVAVEVLRIHNCEKLKSVSTNFRGLDSLELLDIRECPLLESIHEEEGSTSSSSSSAPLSRLRMFSTDNEQVFRNTFNSNITNIKITRNSMLLKCLEEIMKNSSHKLKSFENLIISDYNQLQSLPTGCLPHSLDTLELYRCPQLQSLPADGLPPSLSNLIIQGCPLLYERCKDESALEWHKIKHIRYKAIRP